MLRMEETTPLCLLVAITSIDTGGNSGREKLSRLRGVLSECFYTLQLWASVPSGGTTMDSGRVFMLLAGAPFLSRSSRGAPHCGTGVNQCRNHGMVWLEGLFKGVTIVSAVCPLSSPLCSWVKGAFPPRNSNCGLFCYKYSLGSSLNCFSD